MKIKLISVTIFLLCGLITSVICLHSNSSYPIIQSDTYFEVRGDEVNRIYEYSIKDKMGKVVDSGEIKRMAPSISYISEDMLEIRFHGGTYADLCKYYSIENNLFSQEYWNPYQIQNSWIVYYDATNKELIVQDIFSKDTFYKSYVRDIILTGPPNSISFIDDGKKLCISYLRQTDNEEVTEIIDLYE